jgi:UDP-N-acetylmuramyl pentapeptide phosphotransferase/UDP-N-acetylglucosamine-1-phosphate transferase
MDGYVLGLLAVATFAISLIGTGAVRRMLIRKAILDHPNERSSHTAATPRGGGLAVVPAIIVAWLVAISAGANQGVAIALASAAAALAVLSWIDDLYGLSPQIRLTGHAAAIIAVLITLPAEFNPLAGLMPWPGDVIVTALMLLWFVNLFNFMDGIDGIAAVESITIGGGVALVAMMAGINGDFIPLGITVAAAALGFLWWNRPPARIFLGDVGSVPLGLLLGGLLLLLASEGLWISALILPLYYLVDATLTLVRRALRGEKVWKAHRQHAYQHAVDSGHRHGAVISRVAAANAVLVALAMLSAAAPSWSLPALAGAAGVVGLLLIWMHRPPRLNSPAAP